MTEFEPRLTVEEVLDAIVKLEEVRARSPKVIMINETIAELIQEKHPEVWQNFLLTLRDKSVELWLGDKYGGVVKRCDLRKEIDDD